MMRVGFHNDVERGFAEAVKSGKPLLVVLRCVPCLACAGMDASVLSDAALVPLLEQILVRAVDQCQRARFAEVSIRLRPFVFRDAVSRGWASWALHRAPESGALAASVRREGKVLSLDLALPAGWRQKTDISRRVGTWPMRAMATGGLSLEDLRDAERTARGLDKTALALLVKHVGQYGKHAVAKNAGFQKDDIIVSVDGDSARRTEGELIGWLLEKRRPGEQAVAIVLRGAERVELKLPMQ